jgi:ectoine hydroxylase-related dioxygenase (phytanoyl-CoA dioxygenase family)
MKMLITKEQKLFFDTNGFIEIKNVINKNLLKTIKKKYKKIFDGVYETGVVPDKIKWVKGRDPNNIPRSLCNVWKSDNDVKKLVTSKIIGQYAAELSGWKKTKLNQDSLIWVVPKAGVVSFHQDNPYQDWHTPGGVITAWIPLTKTSKNSATLEYLLGSHKNKTSKRLGSFYSIKDYQKIDPKLLKNQENYKRHYVEVDEGTIVFHHGNIWHGSGFNKTSHERISISVHYMNGSSRFSKKIKSPYFNHYKLDKKIIIDNSFFPNIYSKSI